MTKILIRNFPKPAVSIETVSLDEYKHKRKFHIGHDSQDKSNQILASGLSSFFTSLIIHDEIFLTFDDFGYVLRNIGVADTLSLLDSKIIKIILERQHRAIYQRDLSIAKLRVGGISTTNDILQAFEERISSYAGFDVKTKSQLIQYTDNAKILIPDAVYSQTDSELKSDLSKGTFSNLGITTTSTDDVNQIDSFKLLRIADVTQSLILQNQLAIDSIVQDGFVSQYLDIKLGALASLAGKDSISPFAKIASIKGIPDLYYLYKHRTITMDDILACRNKFSGGLFRQWYSSTDYDEKKILQSLINKGPKQSQLMTLARLVYPNVLGLINPLAGVASSAIDSYIVSKLVEGWSPTLFLDDVYKRKIDELITSAEISEKRKQIDKRFGSVGRNEPCPCQSGKKFKQCHGK